MTFFFFEFPARRKRVVADAGRALGADSVK